MSLSDALNSRLSRQADAVPVAESLMILAEASPLPPRPADPVVTLVRDPVPGELGGHHMDVYPVAEYSVEAFETLLTRMSKACTYMTEHIGDAAGQAQVGYFCDLAEAVHCMAIAHATKGILERKA